MSKKSRGGRFKRPIFCGGEFFHVFSSVASARANTRRSLIRVLTRQRLEHSRISDLLIELAIVARQHIRINLATLSRLNLAPHGHLKFARHLHFNIACRPRRNPATKNWKLGRDRSQCVTNRLLTMYGIPMSLVGKTLEAAILPSRTPKAAFQEHA
jgi:hypothetical protein